jgi:hypothetical protein
MTSFISFARRHNRDRSIDSICTRCYQTVANSEKVDDLDSVERRHVCDPHSAILLNGVERLRYAG